MQWDKIHIKTIDDAEVVSAQAPVIISASRSTDIPAFYSDWFIDWLKKGYLKWKNPFNGVPLTVSFKKTRAIVFWTKNPRPMMKHLDYLEKHYPQFYFQFSLNDYDNEKYEAKVPKLASRIETFKILSERIGKKRMIWRFDPLILTQDIDVVELLRRVESIGQQLKNHTEKLVFSFADIAIYKKVERNLRNERVDYIEFTSDTMMQLAEGISHLNKKNQWGFKLGTCAEHINLDEIGVEHNKCIDDDLLADLYPEDKALMDFLGFELCPEYETTEQFDMFEFSDDNNSTSSTQIRKKAKVRKLKDKGQREDCGCVYSKDIGQYNTCPHECNYCYANASKEIAKNNYKSHKNNPYADTITGN
jgi:DNA repair photolyase